MSAAAVEAASAVAVVVVVRASIQKRPAAVVARSCPWLKMEAFVLAVAFVAWMSGPSVLACSYSGPSAALASGPFVHAGSYSGPCSCSCSTQQASAGHPSNHPLASPSSSSGSSRVSVLILAASSFDEQ